MNEKFEHETVEKVPTPRKELIISTAYRILLKELRIIWDGLAHGLRDSFHLLKRVFIPQSADKAIRPEASWFEIIPKNPNGKAVILSHGFAATPEIFKELARKLADEGYYVRAVRLSGHGTSLGHLAQTSSVDWFASVVWHYQKISEDYDDISFIGHSLGGTLGMILATIYPITTIVAMAAPIELDIPPAKFVRQASILVKYWPRSKGKREMIEREGLSTYTASPLYAIGGIFEACKMIRQRADLLTLPMLYIRAMEDHKTLLVQPKKIEKYLTSTPVTIKVAENSPHSMLQGPERELISSWIIDWLAKY